MGAANAASNLTFDISVRESNREQAEPVIKLIKDIGGKVNVSYIETF